MPLICLFDLQDSYKRSHYRRLILTSLDQSFNMILIVVLVVLQAFLQSSDACSEYMSWLFPFMITVSAFLCFNYQSVVRRTCLAGSSMGMRLRRIVTHGWYPYYPCLRRTRAAHRRARKRAADRWSRIVTCWQLLTAWRRRTEIQSSTRRWTVCESCSELTRRLIAGSKSPCPWRPSQCMRITFQAWKRCRTTSPSSNWQNQWRSITSWTPSACRTTPTTRRAACSSSDGATKTRTRRSSLLLHCSKTRRQSTATTRAWIFSEALSSFRRRRSAPGTRGATVRATQEDLCPPERTDTSIRSASRPTP